MRTTNVITSNTIRVSTTEEVKAAIKRAVALARDGTQLVVMIPSLLNVADTELQAEAVQSILKRKGVYLVFEETPFCPRNIDEVIEEYAKAVDFLENEILGNSINDMTDLHYMY